MRSFFSIVVVASILWCPYQAHADGSAAIPCLDASGNVKNADSADVCKAILPTCTDMKAKLIAQMKDMLEWKIYGYYYLGKDIKLDSLSGMKAGGTPDGDPLPYTICSVVGHKISGGDHGEITTQNIGPGSRSCGDLPTLQNGDAWNYRTKIQYNGTEGTRWFSYVLGAFPWELRRNASEVINQIKDDLSNLDEVIHMDAMSADIVNTLKDIKTAKLALSADAATTCNQPPEKSIITSCLTPGGLAITDPVQKLCTLAKSQLALNEAALPNMLV
jgi:hypothetical protein